MINILSIFICEDNFTQRKQLEEIIGNFIMIEDLNMTLTLSSSSPQEILDYLEKNPQKHGIYFLDVELADEINGIQLGSLIRNKDPLGKIIFITTHSELLMLTFTYKVEALDYISKEDFSLIRPKILSALKQAQKHHMVFSCHSSQLVTFKIAKQLRVFQIDEIMYIETSPIPHKLVLHLINQRIEFYGRINEIEALNPSLIRVHKSFVINYDKIREINYDKGLITLTNSETCLLSKRRIKNLKAKLKIN